MPILGKQINQLAFDATENTSLEKYSNIIKQVVISCGKGNKK